ncbi:hypothetical protein BJ741DRAFT_576534 [Chytriomyces cf. hyalinus JEL632]|nr:hypothetical protein BJ741DRAFT_576534 [Chytriomyces cf. hyalinus JEL632]
MHKPKEEQRVTCLPNELLQLVFAHLRIEELLVVGCVNKCWRHNSRSNLLWKRITLSVSYAGIICRTIGQRTINLQPTFTSQGSTQKTFQTTLRLIPASRNLLKDLKTQLIQIEALDTPWHDVHDNTLLSFLAAMPNLKSMNLNHCTQLSVSLIPFLPTMVPHLQSVDLSYTHMDDAALRFLASQCRNLVRLNVSQCLRLTDEGVVEICSTMADRVVALKLSACLGVSADGYRKVMQTLALRARKLKLLDVSRNSVSKINFDALLEFATLRKNSLQHEQKRNLAVDILGDGSEFTREEVQFVQAADPSLTLIHNARMASHSKDGVKEYLETLMNANNYTH